MIKFQWPIIQNKQQSENISFDIRTQNELLQAIYKWITKGYALDVTDDIETILEESFMKNPIVFGVISKLAVMAKEVPYIICEEKKDGSLEEIINSDDPFVKRMKQPNKFQFFRSWIEEFYTFYLTTGNGMAYFRQLQYGNDKGKIDDNGIMNIPSQNVLVQSEGWRRPIDKYLLDLDNMEHPLEPENVLHVKFTNLDYREGRNLMGMSPLKVAYKKSRMLNALDAFLANNFERGLPPGILSMIDKTDSGKKEKDELKRAYKKNYTGERNSGIPIIGTGKMEWTKIGFDTFRDLMINEMSAIGAREICTVFGVSSRYFANDTQGTTYTNFREDKAAAYTARIIPDLNDVYEAVTYRIAKLYNPNYIIKADTSGIEELQENKKDKAVWLNTGVSNRSISRNEFREGMGYDRYDNPDYDDPDKNSLFYVPPDEPTAEDTDKYLKEKGIKIYE